MKREKLIRQLAWAIACLLNGSQLTYANVRRYIRRRELKAFRIRDTTTINPKEWIHALFIARAERRTRIKDGIPWPRSPSRARIDRVHDAMGPLDAWS